MEEYINRNNNTYSNEKEKAIIVGVLHNNQESQQLNDYLDELELLADTAGAKVLAREVQERQKIHPATYIGKGKVEYLSELVSELGANLIIFDDDLSPAQVKNIERICKVKILDRSGIILDIFARHAQTKEAKTQVELAQLNYLMPRLTRRWTHLSRQAGGAGIGLRGPGETQLEVDKRLITRRITKLKNELLKISKQRQIRRKHRLDCYKVALVGYTNVGKSTLLNSLTDADIFVEDRLFATLDSTVRRMENRENLEILMIDTVGFIRKLPHHLVASFKSTLEEIQEADLLLHVIDISAPNMDEQIKSVETVLDEIGVSEKPVLYVFNKVDRLKDRSFINQCKEEYYPSSFVSAERNLLINELKDNILISLGNSYLEVNIKLSIYQQKEVAQIYNICKVLEKNFVNEHVDLRVRIKKDNFAYIEQFVN